MSVAKPGQLWEETNTKQQHLVIGSDPGSLQVLINGAWKPEDLTTQGYTLVSRSAASTVTTLQATVASLQTQLASTTATAQAAVDRLNAAGL